MTSTGASETTPWLHLLVDQRFFPIFSVLFGVGFWLLFAGAANRSARPRLVLLRRLLVLLAIGLAHLLLWPGDILSVYAVVGVLVLLPSTWLPRWAVAGLAVALLAASVLLGHGGTGSTVVPGLFLLGVALARYGVVDRMESSTWVPAALGMAFATGAVPAVRWQVAAGAASRPGADQALAMAVAGLLLAGVYVCVLLVLLRTPVRPVLRAAFVPLGRMALTNYVTATPLVLGIARVIGGVPDRWSSATVLVIAGGVLAIQWLWSTLWLRRHRYGPLEWLWRWATWIRRPAGDVGVTLQQG